MRPCYTAGRTNVTIQLNKVLDNRFQINCSTAALQSQPRSWRPIDGMAAGSGWVWPPTPLLLRAFFTDWSREACALANPHARDTGTLAELMHLLWVHGLCYCPCLFLIQRGWAPASSGHRLQRLTSSLPAFIKVLQAATPPEELGMAECCIRPRKHNLYLEAGAAPFL